jgi:ATP-dependent helicase/nuclease subunit A
VARLLLAKAEAETILCVTYTKAAPSEMQRRLFERWAAGRWPATPPARRAGQAALARAGQLRRQDLSEARGLFAAALETPGGLKIQTIHAFCEKVLRRFPLEAGVPPGFRVMDEPAAAAVARPRARTVAHHVLTSRRLADAYAASRSRSTSAASRRCSPSSRPAAGAGRLPRPRRRPGGATAGSGAPSTSRPDRPGRPGARRMARWTATSTAGPPRRCARRQTDAERARPLAPAAADAADFDDAVALFFTKDGEPRNWVGTSKRLKARPTSSLPAGRAGRLEAVRERMRAAQVGRDSVDALRWPRLSRGLPDREGRLRRARLRRPGREDLRACCATGRGAWVLFKLDGGIDHILLDEAQDTAPEQWAIVDALTDEFFSGRGRRERGAAARPVRRRRPQAVDLLVPGRAARAAGGQVRVPPRPGAGAGYRSKRRPAALLALDAAGAALRRRGLHAGASGEAIQPRRPVRHDVADPRRRTPAASTSGTWRSTARARTAAPGTCRWTSSRGQRQQEAGRADRREIQA